MPLHPRTPPPGAWLLLALLLPAPGCPEALGPENFPVAPVVTGKILCAGRPVPSGFVEFLPIEDAVGNLRSAPLAPDGSFRATRVPVGPNSLRVINPPPSAGVPGYAQSMGSPVRVVVSPDGPNDFLVDVLTLSVTPRNPSDRQPDNPPDNPPAP